MKSEHSFWCCNSRWHLLPFRPYAPKYFSNYQVRLGLLCQELPCVRHFSTHEQCYPYREVPWILLWYTPAAAPATHCCGTHLQQRRQHTAVVRICNSAGNTPLWYASATAPATHCCGTHLQQRRQHTAVVRTCNSAGNTLLWYSDSMPLVAFNCET